MESHSQVLFLTYLYQKERKRFKMEELIRRISRDNEPYEVDKADPVIIQSLSGGTLSEDEINQLDVKEQATLKEGMRQFLDTQAACLNDIIVRNGCYFESRFAGNYRIIRRIIKMDGQRVAN